MLGLAACFLVGARDRGEVWKELAPREGGFVIRMPGEPLARKERMPVASGCTELVTYVVERKSQKAAFIVLTCSIPETMLQSASGERRLDDACKKAAMSVRGKLESMTRIEMNRYPGRELHFAVEGNGLVRQQMFAVNERFYQLLVAGPREAALGKEADRFFRSFRLKP
jgi:hypothetical protein